MTKTTIDTAETTACHAAAITALAAGDYTAALWLLRQVLQSGPVPGRFAALALWRQLAAEGWRRTPGGPAYRVR